MSRAPILLAFVSAAAVAAPCTELPVLFIVQDKSGSMAAVPDPAVPSAPSKWTTAKTVVPQVAAQFSNRFRFGVMMYPNQSTTFSCTTGTTVAPVPSTANDVNTIYLSSAAGGGTPTATSLSAAKTYLLSLGLTAPTHVLLITDGLPNCNLSNNAATCQTTTAGCLNTSTCTGSSCCGLGAKDCLDDNATVQAAAALKNAGIKVYVVGFGASVGSANDKAVLDAIAAAGGTGSSYVATSSGALTTALNTIAASTATCCLDACANGAAVCTAQGQRQTCGVDAATGCTAWTTTSCPTMSACVGGQCQTCTNACAAGALRCSGGNAQACQPQSNGCTAWVTTQACGYGSVCNNGACSSCQACAAGAAQCTAAGVQTCDWNVLTGCTAWVQSICQSGTRCTSGACTSCTTTCTAGAKRCTGTTVETCLPDAQGCTSWQAGQQCQNFCSGGACGACGTTCTLGTGRCNGNGTETCTKDVNNCTVWTAGQTCAAGSSCAGGSCAACAVTCTVGAKRCSGNGLEQCTATGTGCNTWASAGACAAGETCQGGACIPPCQDACTLGAAKCNGAAPSVCEKAPTGCTVWKAQAACPSASTVCLEGACRALCVGGELETCPGTDVCTGMPNGDRVCLPSTPVTPVVPAPDAGHPVMQQPSLVPVDEEPPASKVSTSSGGCGCASGGEGLGALVLLALLGIRRRAAR